LSLGFNGLEQTSFHDLGEVYVTDKPLKKSEIVFSTEIFLDDNIIVHYRDSYGVLDLLESIGGVIQILYIFCHFFLGSYNETSFVFKVIS
jgi:hypothetical protein